MYSKEHRQKKSRNKKGKEEKSMNSIKKELK